MKLPLATAWFVVASGLMLIRSAEVGGADWTTSAADETPSSPISSENGPPWPEPEWRLSGERMVRLPLPYEEWLAPATDPISGDLTTATAAATDESGVGGFGHLLPEGIVPFWGPRTSEEHRDSGLGSPLEGTSWLAHAHSAGCFAGPIEGATFLNRQLDPGYGSLFGLRFGWDYDHRWGLEKRFGFAQMNVLDIQQHVRQIVNFELGDADLLFYPWGDSVWRPFIMAGVGLSHFNFQDDTGHRINRILFGMPFGMGVKYFYTEGVSIRLDLVDNLMLGGGGIDTMNNLSLTLGAEFRYDGFGLAHHAARR